MKCRFRGCMVWTRRRYCQGHVKTIRLYRERRCLWCTAPVHDEDRLNRQPLCTDCLSRKRQRDFLGLPSARIDPHVCRWLHREQTYRARAKAA